jgi:hypothetical protein
MQVLTDSEIGYSKSVGTRRDIPVIAKRTIQALPKIFGMFADMHRPFHSGVKCHFAEIASKLATLSTTKNKTEIPELTSFQLCCSANISEGNMTHCTEDWWAAKFWGDANSFSHTLPSGYGHSHA